jgi:hypothetical protein
MEIANKTLNPNAYETIFRNVNIGGRETFYLTTKSRWL